MANDFSKLDAQNEIHRLAHMTPEELAEYQSEQNQYFDMLQQQSDAHHEEMVYEGDGTTILP